MTKTRRYVYVTFLMTLILFMTFTSYGYFNLTPFIRVTLIQIPVIIGSLWFGWRTGALLGFAFGMSSLIYNTINPVVTSFVFSPFYPVIGTDQGSPLALIIAFVPRILVGIVPWFVYQGLKKIERLPKIPRIAISALMGSLTNTLLVLGLIYVLFGTAYAQARSVAVESLAGILLTTISVNGVVEAICSSVIVTALFTRIKVNHQD
ncbi:hypothetical protein AOC36_02675 [Erysipelothrix larvae]|uniref:ECF transporter S component n=1 Tax=Erysipelothrix larvae TaxID=1514105 RepID=A0A120JTI0_9FIRM|nr:ECF transporter S component [Erysipelothrix larvae]AMC92927.1 hypothetical protein AOC36_02675 [Erysipelothrix larvae]